MAEIKIQVLLDDAGLQKQIAGANKLLLRFSANAKKLSTKRVREEIQISEKLYRDHDSRRLAQAKRLNQQLLSIHRQRINQETISERSIATTRDRLYRRSMTTGMLGGGAGRAAGVGRGAGGAAAYSPLAIASMLSGGGGVGAGATATTAAGAALGAAAGGRLPPGSLVILPKLPPTDPAMQADQKKMWENFAEKNKGKFGTPPVSSTAKGSNKQLNNALMSSLGMGTVARFGLYGGAFLGIQATLSAMKDMLDYEKALYDFGKTARLTNVELSQLAGTLNDVSLSAGQDRNKLLDDMRDTYEKISKAIGSTDIEKITGIWKILQATGTGKDTFEALDGAFKTLKMNEKNIINLANLMQLPGASGIKTVEELAKFLEDIKNKGGIQIFSDKAGTTLRSFSDIWNQILAAKTKGGGPADFLKDFTAEKVKNINDIASAMERLQAIGEREPGAGFQKMATLFKIIGGVTVTPAINALNQLAGSLVVPENVQALRDAKKDLKDLFASKKIIDFLNWNKGDLFPPGAPKPKSEEFTPPWWEDPDGLPTQITIINHGGVSTEVIDTSGRGKKVEVKKVQR